MNTQEVSDTKDVTIRGARFQLSRMSALTGSWIVNVLLSATFKAERSNNSAVDSEEPEDFKKLSPEEKANHAIAAMWMGAGSLISEENVAKIQKACLKTCFLYVSDSAPAIPVLNGDRWADKKLERDISTVSQLIVESLQFNFSPFFTESASKPAEATEARLNPPDSRTATGTSSAQ